MVRGDKGHANRVSFLPFEVKGESQQGILTARRKIAMSKLCHICTESEVWGLKIGNSHLLRGKKCITPAKNKMV